MEELNGRIIKNIVENIRDQYDDSTFYHSWTDHDLELKISSEIKVQQFRDVITLYCADKVHTSSEYSDA